ncbi:MAG: NAD(P)-dependent oxidoreductase [Synergistaceae bacterium]|nr:NAD(P)-dependent oxidoreductase [Synergistaceae bacterium]MBQ3448543.1 NAD(P)-dependent oxidoreductase [Synergistaceae bacterium]MBQ6111463.1 NAD(P)-dependent oxidoreductase [Synergistaceae bacterium]MBR0249646.1 NAD(P)-dependent oxidoreductase [Synergistaceae bacterium]
MPLHIVTEAKRCLQCKNPKCQQGCPVHTPIPEIIKLFKENKLMEAGEILFRNNPLSVICSEVCNHAKQCAGNCIRGIKDSPVHFSSIENYISDMYLDRMHASVPLKRIDKHVAVIGAGPAGITVAVLLAMEGYHVTIFEWHSKIGGVMQYGIPEFRLPKSILDRYEARLEEFGIQIRLNATIGSTLIIDNLIRDGYDCVFIGTGAERPRSLGIKGESLGNVHFAMNYLANPKAHHLGNRVAVIGVGNAAMDVARTALRNGTKEVTMYAMGKEIAASSSEVAYAKLDGAEIETGMQVQEITEQGPVFKRTKYGENDEIIGTEDELIQTYADSTIIAISQIPRAKLVRTTSGLLAGDNGLLIVDENYMTTKRGVFAAGDVVTGAKTVVHAVDGAKKAAEAMKKYMNGEL